MSRFRTLLLAGIAGMTVATTGCVFDSNEPQVFIEWDLLYIGTDMRLACEDAGATEVVLRARHSSGKEFTDRFPCDAFQGISQDLPSGSHELTVTLVAQGDRPLSQLRQNVIVGNGVNRFDLVIFDIQAFVVSWSIVRGNMPLTCAQAGAQTVRLSTLVGEGPPDLYDFPCSDGRGITTAVGTGVYTVQLSLVGSGDRIVTQTMPRVVTLLGPNDPGTPGAYIFRNKVAELPAETFTAP